ncbi:MAG: amidohydrolase family protein, partial [Myxococcota bacterium]
VGLSAVVGPTLQDLKGPGVADLESQLSATLELEDWSERGIWSAVAPHATDTVSDTLWQRVAELVEDPRRVVHAHVAQSVEEFEISHERHGCSPTEYLDRLGVLAAGAGLWVHMVFASRSDLRRLDPERHALGFCPLSATQFAFPAFVADWDRWFVATDCASSNDAMNLQRELPVVAAMRALVTTGSSTYERFRNSGALADAQDTDSHRKDTFDAMTRFNDPNFLLSRVWSVPGRLHPGFTAGVIEKGALANLLVLDPRHPSLWPERDLVRTLALADTQGALRKVMVRGDWIALPSADDPGYLDARDEAARRFSELLQRIGL